MKKWHPMRLLALGSIFVLSACSTVQAPSKSDPFEGLNRTVFQFNETVDKFAFKPVAKAYNRVLPQPVRTGITNFFSNIGDFYTALNNLLQGKVQAGAEDVMRISINSLFGIGGVFDVATVVGLPKHQQDFGQTLGHYGVHAGPYLVLPLLGPSTVRDTAGFLVDRMADPTTYIRPNSDRNALYIVRLISARASVLQTTDLLSQVTFDKYAFMRDAYLQRRRYLIRGTDNSLTYEDDYKDEPSVSNAASGAQSVTMPAAGVTVVPSAPNATQGVSTPAATLDSSPEKSTPKSMDNMVVPPSHIMPPTNYLPSLRLL